MFRLTIVSSLRGCFGGCFFNKMSWTLSDGALGSNMVSICSGRPVVLLAIILSATPILPSIISFENYLEVWSVGAFRLLLFLDKQFWIVCPSSNKLSRFLSFHRLRQRSKCFTADFQSKVYNIATITQFTHTPRKVKTLDLSFFLLTLGARAQRGLQ